MGRTIMFSFSIKMTEEHAVFMANALNKVDAFIKEQSNN
jgi:hypothetical protein